MNENKTVNNDEAVKLVTDFASQMYIKGVLDGCKYTLMGMAVGAVCMFAIDSAVKRKLKSEG